MVFNAEGKRVYIAMDSKALGDSLAWIPYVQEFKKQHKCEVISIYLYERYVFRRIS